LTCVHTITSDTRGAFRATETGETYDALICAQVTCDGTYMFLDEVGRGVRDAADKYINTHHGASMGDLIFTERHHRADMAYGKNVQVVTWSVAIPIRHGAPEPPTP